MDSINCPSWGSRAGSGVAAGVIGSAGFSRAEDGTAECSSAGDDGLDDPLPNGHSEYALLESTLDRLVVVEARRRSLGFRRARFETRGECDDRDLSAKRSGANTLDFPVTFPEYDLTAVLSIRSEERRVGKECQP